MEIEFFSNEEFINAMIKLKTDIDQWIEIHGPFDYIVGVPRGGIIPAVYLSHAFNIKLDTDVRNCNNLIGLVKPSHILVVDDIVDTGKTLVKINSTYGEQVMFASICVRKNAPTYPNFYGCIIEHDKHLNFDWESWYILNG